MSHLGDLTCALIDAELDGHAHDQALSHLAGCPHCLRAVADQRWVKAHLAVAVGPAVPPDDLFARLLRIPAAEDAEDADDVGFAPLTGAAPFSAAADSRTPRRRSPLAGAAPGRSSRPLPRSASRDGRRPVPLRPARLARLAAARRVGARSVVAASFAASVVVGLGGTVSGSSAASAGRTVSPAAATSATTVALVGAAVPRPATRPSVSVVYRRP